MTGRPVCVCHGEPMYWHKYNDGRRGGGIWRCRAKRKPLDADRWQSYYYERMPFEVRIRQSLATRRRDALKRRRARQLRRAES